MKHRAIMFSDCPPRRHSPLLELLGVVNWSVLASWILLAVFCGGFWFVVWSYANSADRAVERFSQQLLSGEVRR
jgi:Flp pilus assembly protein TadB